METTTYDPKKVTVALNGKALTGFAADGIIVVTHNEDSVTPTVGSKGDVAYAENANESGNAAIPLLSTSSSMAYIRSLCAGRKPIRLTVSDANNNDAVQVSAEDCRILKMPDLQRNKEATTVSVSIYIPQLTYR